MPKTRPGRATYAVASITIGATSEGESGPLFDPGLRGFVVDSPVINPFPKAGRWESS